MLKVSPICKHLPWVSDVALRQPRFRVLHLKIEIFPRKLQIFAFLRTSSQIFAFLRTSSHFLRGEHSMSERCAVQTLLEHAAQFLDAGDAAVLMILTALFAH